MEICRLSKKRKSVLKEISVNKILSIFLFSIIIYGCSLDTKSGLWTKTQKITKEEVSKKKIKQLFKEERVSEKEFNPTLKIRLISNPQNNSFINNFDNNNGRINYAGELKKISKFRFSKIDNFNQFEPNIIFHKEDIIFFDNKGSILKFDKFSKLIWKKNFYNKREKKLKPILSFGNNSKILIVADSIAKYYALDINTGELLWSKNNTAPFNSQIKVDKDKFFVVDFDNVLKSFSLKDGNEVWKIKTDKSLIRSQKKNSLVVVDGKVYFTNSIGDITGVDIESGNLIWQTPTQRSTLYEDLFFLKNSDIIFSRNTLIFSNNKNELFSFDVRSGLLNWKQKINSSLRSTLIDDYIFTVTMEGFLVVTNYKNGNIIRITDLFKKYRKKISKKKKKNKLNPIGFIMGKKNKNDIIPVGFIVGINDIYLTTNKGRLLIIDISSGKTKSSIKIDNAQISRPFILNQNLYIVKDNGIVKIN